MGQDWRACGRMYGSVPSAAAATRAPRSRSHAAGTVAAGPRGDAFQYAGPVDSARNLLSPNSPIQREP